MSQHSVESDYNVNLQHGERIAKLEATLQATLPNLATKEDIESLKRFIENSLHKSETKSLKWFVGTWALVAGIGPSSINAIVSFFTNSRTSP